MALPAGRRGVRPDQVKPDGTLNVTEPTPYELPVASAETLGGVKVGSGLSIAEGVLSASGYSLPTASAETLGGVKVGSGLSIADGVLSASGGGAKYLHNITGVGVDVAVSFILISDKATAMTNDEIKTALSDYLGQIVFASGAASYNGSTYIVGGICPLQTVGSYDVYLTKGGSWAAPSFSLGFSDNGAIIAI